MRRMGSLVILSKTLETKVLYKGEEKKLVDVFIFKLRQGYKWSENWKTLETEVDDESLITNFPYNNNRLSAKLNIS